MHARIPLDRLDAAHASNAPARSSGPVGAAPAYTIRECYRELVSLCTEHRIRRALVVSSDADATDDAALSEAMAAMASAGLAPGFRLAMVAERPHAFSVYRSAEQGAASRGIAARAFRTRREAVQWLTGNPPRHRS